MKAFLPVLFLVANLLPGNQPDEKKAIVFFSFDQGMTWENKSNGLPDDIVLTDIATGDHSLGVATKRHGIFLFDFQTNQWKGLAAIPAASDDIDALYFYHGKIWAGSHSNGIFVSDDGGKSWALLNTGLSNLTIRRLLAIDNALYAGTNGGLFRLDERTGQWSLVFGKGGLQVNGIKEFDGEIYIGTNQGAFKADRQGRNWKQIMNNHSLHNIGTAHGDIYALAYNELFISSDKGRTWSSDQKGMPAGKYTFQIVEQDRAVLAGQWDGVYVKNPMGWKPSNKGLPDNFAVIELAAFEGIIVAASSGWSAIGNR